MNTDSLLKRYGSPAYIYELEEVRSACRALRASLPAPSQLYYSIKANPHIALVRELKNLGCRAEVSSLGELNVALDSGMPAELCLYTGPGKSRREIEYVLKHGVSHLSVESEREFLRIEESARVLGITANVLLRINPDEPVLGSGLAMGGRYSQFGIDSSEIVARAEAFTGFQRARVVGFHFYEGTNLVSTDALFSSFGMAVRIAGHLSKVLGIRLQVVNLGGGFGHPFATEGVRPDLSQLRAPLEHLLDVQLPGWRDGVPQIVFESGRYLVAGCGTLLCRVEDVKTSKSRTFVVLDSGIHHLGGMAGLRRVPRIVPDLVPIEGRPGLDILENASVVGPLCTPLDCWGQGVRTAVVQAGDALKVPNVGAYGLTASLLAFTSRDCPVEVVLDRGEVRDVSRLTLRRGPEPMQTEAGGD